MANIAASDLTYSFNIKDKKCIGSAGYSVRGTIIVGDNSLTYGSGGGVALTKGKMGLPRYIRSFKVIGSSSNKYSFDYVPSTEKLILKVPAGSSANPTVNLISAGSNAAANAAIFSNAGVLSHNVANASGVTGVIAGAFTGSGTAELGNVAVTTSTLQIEAEGY